MRPGCMGHGGHEGALKEGSAKNVRSRGRFLVDRDGVREEFRCSEEAELSTTTDEPRHQAHGLENHGGRGTVLKIAGGRAAH